jgi:Trk K+ transport system NAD-binding subunit
MSQDQSKSGKAADNVAFAGDRMISLDNPSFRTRLRYNFDSSFGAGPAGALKWLLGTIAVLSLPLMLAVQITQETTKVPILGKALTLNEAPHGIQKWIDAYYQTFLIFLGKATFTSSSWTARIFAWVGIAISMVITATLFGFVITNVNGAMAKLKKGRGIVLEEGQTTIIGWTPQIFSMITQIEKSNESEERQGILVIIANIGREIMVDEVSHRVGETKHTRIIFKSGDPANPRVLVESSISKSKNIIVLGNYWALTTQLILAIQACLPAKSQIPIIAEISDENTANILKSASKTPVYSLNREDFVSRITAHSVLQPGITNVILDLLDFDGSEIYVKAFKQAEGKSFGEIQQSFNAIPLGIFKRNNEVVLAPDSATRVEEGDRIIGLAVDSSKFTWRNVETSSAQVTPVATMEKTPKTAENILIIGWSRLARFSVLEISKVCAPGTKFTFFGQTGRVPLEEYNGLENPNISIDIRQTSGTAEELSAMLNSQEFTRIGVFGYKTRGLPMPESEAITLLTCTQIAHDQRNPNCKSKDAFVVAEIQDVANTSLAHQIDLDDLVISDRLSTLMMSQLAETNELGEVFNELFGPRGAFIQAKPASAYVELGQTKSFEEIQRIGQAHGDIILGYQEHARTQAMPSTILDPGRSTMLTPSHEMSFVVLGEL